MCLSKHWVAVLIRIEDAARYTCAASGKTRYSSCLACLVRDKQRRGMLDWREEWILVLNHLDLLLQCLLLLLLESLQEHWVQGLLSLQLLLILQVHAVPLVLRVEVVDVYYMLARPGCLLEHLVRLVVARLQELIEVEVGKWRATVWLNVRCRDHFFVEQWGFWTDIIYW